MFICQDQVQKAPCFSVGCDSQSTSYVQISDYQGTLLPSETSSSGVVPKRSRLFSLMEMTVKMLKVRRNSYFLSAAERFKKQCLSVLEILFPRRQTNQSWGTVFSTCKDSWKPIGLCDSRALGGEASILHFSEHLASLEVSPRSLDDYSLISLLNTSMQLEVNLFFQSLQQQPWSFSFPQSLWSTHGVLYMAVIPTPFLSAAPSHWECYLWSFLNFLWGPTPLFWQQLHPENYHYHSCLYQFSV